MNRKIRVVLSTGQGRLHLITAARFIAAAGVDLSVVTSWIPRNPEGLLVRFCSRVVGRDLSFGMKKRVINLPGVEVHAMAFAEFLFQGMRLVDNNVFGGRFRSWVAEFGWKVYGWMSRRYLSRDATVFHCRSGAGQGGAIKVAKLQGMKVLVDHSALHPAQSELNLRDECLRWGQSMPIVPTLGVWRNVLKDCQEADVIMVNADHIRDSFVERGYNPRKVKVVRLGVRSDFFGLKKDYQIGSTVRILYTGGFSLLKGAEYTLESVRLLKERGVNVHLDVVGSIGIPNALLRKYATLPVTYHGVVPQDDLKSFLSESDIYLFPSLADGCAQSGMEALAAGLPVVATYQSGLPITDGKTGLVVPMKNALAIADRIEWLAGCATEREHIGRAATKMIADNYTWEKYGENVKKLYEELLAR